MMIYTFPFDDLPSGAAQNTFQTIAAILSPDTLGARCRLRELDLGFSDDTPPDSNLAVGLRRIADVSGGGAGTADATLAAANMGKADSGQIDCLMTGPNTYSNEPTTYETAWLWGDDLNTHGGILKCWDIDAAPKCLRDQLLGLLVAPRIATAVRLSGTFTFETF